MSASKTILVTGGTGYIGSHCCVALQACGYDIVILDNLSNSQRQVVDRIAKISGTHPHFIEGDTRDPELLDRIFRDHAVDAVMHFAGLKAVAESVIKPLDYYDCNIHGTTQLLKAMSRAKVRTIVFSSSATVYGEPNHLPIHEDSPRHPVNPYGRTKKYIEDILADLHASEAGWKIARLRYFNPVGAHDSGLIGENPLGMPNNLIPLISQVAIGTQQYLNIWGNDYPTPDGTGIRDYIHVADLADGHIAALNYLEKNSALMTLNLGTGKGHSVLDVIRAYETVSGRKIPYRIAPRRPGDLAQYWADCSAAFDLLHWKATRSVENMCLDAWKWQLAASCPPVVT